MTLGLWTVWAALAAMVVTFVVGVLWYGLLRGPYMRLTGMDAMTEAEKERAQEEARPGYVASLLLTALSVVLLAFLVTWAIPGSPYGSTWLLGISLATAGWIAFYVPGTLTATFYEGEPLGLWAIKAGYWGLVAVASGFLVGWFHPGL